MKLWYIDVYGCVNIVHIWDTHPSTEHLRSKTGTAVGILS